MERPHSQGAAVGMPALEAPAHVAQEHPKARVYVAVFVVLFIVTAVEVAIPLYFPQLPQVPLLLALGATKFLLVVAFYMHLRYDSRAFSALFIVGMLIAIGMFLSLLALFAVSSRTPFVPTLEHGTSAAGTPAAGAATSARP